MNIFQINPIISLIKLTKLTKMATKITMDTIKSNAELTKQTISLLKSELKVLNEEYNTLRAKQLREENAKLLAAVETAKARLVQAEMANGIPQIPVPGTKVSEPKQQKAQEQEEQQHGKGEGGKGDKEKPKKEKKAAKAKEQQSLVEAPVDIGRLDLRVAKIVDVQRHPDADTLYLLKINCGEEMPRTVCSGLVKHIPMEELQDRSVMLLCNLKPAKMRGIMSEAMVMCASTPEKVEVLLPPPDSNPGDLVDCAGFTRQPDTVMNPKKKIFETVAPDLHVNDQMAACYKGVPLKVINKGHIVAQTLKNVAVK